MEAEKGREKEGYFDGEGRGRETEGSTGHSRSCLATFSVTFSFSFAVSRSDSAIKLCDDVTSSICCGPMKGKDVISDVAFSFAWK